MHSSIHGSEIIPASYALLHSDRDGRGGAVAIAIEQSLSFQQDRGIAKHESTWCNVRFGDSSILMGAIYRRPGETEDYLRTMYDLLHNKVNDRTKLLITGDFNLPRIDWDAFGIGSKEVDKCEWLLDLMLSLPLTQIVKEPIRVQENSSAILDLAFVSDPLSPIITLEEGISDHKMLVLTFPNINTNNKRAKSPAKIAVKDYSRAKDQSVIDYLDLTSDNFSTGASRCVNSTWVKLKNTIQHWKSNFIPIRYKIIKRKTPWVSRSMIHSKKLRRKRKSQKNTLEVLELSCQQKLGIKAARSNYFH